MKRPGDQGADVAVAEGQPLGIPLSFGGPYLGLFAAKQRVHAADAGRLVGQTVDAEGKRAFCLTLQTREQHIRREKATSNVCTNQGLMALRASIYMAAMGPQGLRQVAQLCHNKAAYFAAQAQANGLRLTVRGQAVLQRGAGGAWSSRPMRCRSGRARRAFSLAMRWGRTIPNWATACWWR